MAKEIPPEAQASARRMKALRISQGYSTQYGWASWLGMGQTRWANFERGFPVSQGACDILIRKIPGLTRDWIRDGQESGLPLQLARTLRDAQAELDAPAPIPIGRAKRAS